jgi:hypothetical protein
VFWLKALPPPLVVTFAHRPFPPLLLVPQVILLVHWLLTTW